MTTDHLTDLSTRLAPLKRDLVSDGYDEATGIISQFVNQEMHPRIDLTVHEYATGNECFTWFIPEKWSCNRAELTTLDGKTIFSDQEHPLHAMSYSLPFDGEVDRKTLFSHLHVHPKLPNAVPFMFKYYERDWGLCCSQKLKESLTHERYRVRIQSNFTTGTLKVSELVLPSESGIDADSYVLCAHLCHPTQFNDGLSGVVAGLEVMRRLAQANPLRHTYRLIICSETIGSAAWLAENEHIIPKIRGGMFLEMLALPHAHALQHSNFPSSTMDNVCAAVMHKHDPASWADGFPKVILNDERMFNSPGIEIPMTSLSRVLPRTHEDFPFRGYHSDFDTVDNASMAGLRDSIDLIEKIVYELEEAKPAIVSCQKQRAPVGPIPLPTWKGELFCSRYKAIDYAAMKHCIHSVPYAMNGQRSVSDIAKVTGHSLTDVQTFLDALAQEGLVTYKG